MKLTVLGPGSWGLTMAWMLAEKVDSMAVWGLKDFIDLIKANRHVKKPVDVKVPETVLLTDNLAEAIEGADMILFVVPSDAVRPVAKELSKLSVPKDTILVNLAKGFELSTLLRMSQVLRREFSENPIATLSGPTLAKEILSGCPTAAVVASEDIDIAKKVQETLSREDLFRLYSNTDIVGVELGGSLKNVIAIATGFAHSLNLGDNALGAMMTRGLAEIVRLSVQMGANPSTLYGLSGMGDLIATCSSPTSRNYSVGYALGQGKKLNEILEELGAVAEGVKTTEAVLALAQKYNVEVPITREVERLLHGDVTPQGAIESIMSRDLKAEELYTLSS